IRLAVAVEIPRHRHVAERLVTPLLRAGGRVAVTARRGDPEPRRGARAPWDDVRAPVAVDIAEEGRVAERQVSPLHSAAARVVAGRGEPEPRAGTGAPDREIGAGTAAHVRDAR